MGTQDWEGTWHISHSREKWLERSSPSTVPPVAWQAHKGTGKHTPAAIVTILSKISHLITASPSATGRRLLHPELRFYPSHSKSFLMHVSLRAASSPSVSKYTHTNTGMTIKDLVIMQRNPMRLIAPTPWHRHTKPAWVAQQAALQWRDLSGYPRCVCSIIPRVIFCTAMPLWNCSRNTHKKPKPKTVNCTA